MKLKQREFILRSPKLEDVDSLWMNYNDEEVARNMISMETEKEFKSDWKKGFKKKDKMSDRLVVEIDGKAVGKVSLRIKDPYNLTKARISSWIGKEFRGKGIMTKAKILACDYWFKKYKLKRIEAGTRIYNKAAQRSLEKSGFKMEGVLRKSVYKDGKWYDDTLWAKIK
jgi:ribosomal-protein-alanine N-acetyltransferase